MVDQATLEQQIYDREGFRVRFTPLNDQASARYQEYAPAYMASGRWSVAEWQLQRLGPYVASFRTVDVLGPDNARVKTTTRLAALRERYFAALCPEEAASARS